MTTKPRTLQEYLQSQSWRHLLAILATHGFSMTSSKAKAPLISQIHAHLAKIEVLESIITQLDATAKDALRQLLVADGGGIE